MYVRNPGAPSGRAPVVRQASRSIRHRAGLQTVSGRLGKSRTTDSFCTQPRPLFTSAARARGLPTRRTLVPTTLPQDLLDGDHRNVMLAGEVEQLIALGHVTVRGKHLAHHHGRW